MQDLLGPPADLPRRPRLGRPARGEEVRRHEELLGVALEIFMERGFERTTVEEIANRVGMSKRTVYARYESKDALFKAAVMRAIELYTVPYDVVVAVATDDLEETLRAVAHQRISNLTTPNSVRLQRVLNAQAYRFPELARAAFDQGTGPAMRFLRELFEHHAALGNVAISEPGRAAGAFLSLAVSSFARLIVSGLPLEKRDVDESVNFAVRLFLDGARPR